MQPQLDFSFMSMQSRNFPAAAVSSPPCSVYIGACSGSDSGSESGSG